MSVTAGWLASSIGAVLRSGVDLPKHFGYVLVTSIDSSTDLPTLPEPQAIVQRYLGARFLGEGLLLPSARIAEVTVAFQLFTGFDEVWCFDDPPTAAKPDDVSLVAPLNLATDEIPSDVIHWMKSSNCRLGLGDGIGLNYLTFDLTVLELLREAAAGSTAAVIKAKKVRVVRRIDNAPEWPRTRLLHEK